MVEYDVLVGQESENATLVYDSVTVYAHENGVLLGFLVTAYLTPNRYCETCPGNCGQNQIIFVDKNRRNEGIGGTMLNISKDYFTVRYATGKGDLYVAPQLAYNEIRPVSPQEDRILPYRDRLAASARVAGQIRSYTGLS